MDNQDEQYRALVSEQAEELFCDNCGHCLIEPMHGHFVAGFGYKEAE